MGQLKKKAIPYSQIITIIDNCEDPRTQAAIAIQYGFATRVGEIARAYDHYYYSKNSEKETVKFVSIGPKNKDFAVKNMGSELNFLKPNFKQRKVFEDKDKTIIEGVDSFTSVVIKDLEPYLFSVIYNWVKSKSFNEVVFDLKHAMLRRVIDRELKKYNSEWSTHWLRQSRAWHIGEATGDPYAVQAILGHGDLNTSLKYVSGLRTSLRKLAVGGKRMNDYLGGVVE